MELCSAEAQLVGKVIGYCHLTVLETRRDLRDQNIASLEGCVTFGNIREMTFGFRFNRQSFL